MSLNISFSNDESKGYAHNTSYFQPPCKKSSKNEDESLYFRLNQLSEVKTFQREPQISQEIEVFGFNKCPKRKIGRCIMKQEKHFVFEENSSGKVRKLRDSFGQAYQEYFLSESSSCKSKEECIYLNQNRKIEKKNG